MKNKPAYGIESVDHALRLAVLLQQEGPLRLTDAAQRLGVARSTAHRLLAMLVYRDFAEQDEQRRYAAGPVIRRPGAPEPVADLRRVALPHLEALAERSGETVSLQVLLGDQARFVATVEGKHVLRVGDREGRLVPAHLASGGKAILALRSAEDVGAVFGSPDSPEIDLDALNRELRRVRRRGYAINDQKTETGVTAIGVAVVGPQETPVAAVCLAAPTARFTPQALATWGPMVTAAARRVEAELAAG